MGKARTKARTEPDTAGLGRDDLLRLFRIIYASRRTDDKEILLKRQNRSFFQINGVGHEAISGAAGFAARPGYDWFFTYYRDRALGLAVGVTPYEQLLQAVGSVEDPASMGRQMPSHWGHAKYNLASASSPIATQYLHAAGCGEAIKRMRGDDAMREAVGGEYHEDEVAIVTGGDGSTSEGEFWEALSSCCVLELPVVFVIEDNGYAISVPREVQTPGDSISKAVAGFKPLLIVECDGTDVIASYAAMREAIDHARSGKGPALVHAHCIRPYSHSMSDDQRLYRTAAEIEGEAGKDPVVNYPRWLVENGLVDEAEIEAIRNEVDAELDDATDRALAAPTPPPTEEHVQTHVYSEEIDPTSDAFATEPVFADDKPINLIDCVNRTIDDEMTRNASIVMLGQDIADATREDALAEVKGKGGVFKATHGLQRTHGSNRVFNSPLAEADILGRTVGMALRGLKPVSEIQFIDYIWPAYEQIRNEWSVMRWRSGGAFSCGSVVRTTYGGYIRGALCHSQCGEVLFTHIPGIRVVCPSNALDAAGLLRTAIRCDDPVLFLEHKHLYRQTYNRSPYPGAEYMIPFGKGRVVREGKDVVIVTFGALVERSRRAAKILAEQHGVEATILDLRTLQPYDWELIAETVQRTNRVVVAHEDNRSWGWGAEIAARIADELFEHLDAPVKRVGALDTFVAYAPDLEDVILPQVEDLVEAARTAASY